MKVFASGCMSRIVVLLLAVTIGGASGCMSSGYLMIREVPNNPLSDLLGLSSGSGPHVTARTEQILRRHDLLALSKEDVDETLTLLHEELEDDATAEKMYAYAELSYIVGVRAEEDDNAGRALDHYGSAVAHAYYYLFDSRFDSIRNPYDPQFRRACDMYNVALESALRIVKRQGKLRPGSRHSIQVGDENLALNIVLRGPWRGEEIEKIEFVSDFDVTGLNNKYRTHGLGVPLIAVFKKNVQANSASILPMRL